MTQTNKSVIYGLYDDETDLLEAVKVANSKHMEIMDVYSPFPVHGLDPLLGLSESRLHLGGFIYGLLGTATAFFGIGWIFTKDWPNIFGGKPYFSFPAWIPIIFELTVLFAAIGMTVTFYVINGLGPGITNKYLDPRITDDKFCIAFDESAVSGKDAESFFGSTGASEVNRKVI